MECIICQDSGVEPLQNNTSCTCKYKRHISCWIDYVHSNKILKCPLCRKEIATSRKPIQPHFVPYTSRLQTIQEENSYQNTYQYEREENIIQGSIGLSNSESKQNISWGKKVVKIVILFGLLTVIIIVLSVFFL